MMPNDKTRKEVGTGVLTGREDEEGGKMEGVFLSTMGEGIRMKNSMPSHMGRVDGGGWNGVDNGGQKGNSKAHIIHIGQRKKGGRAKIMGEGLRMGGKA